MFIGVRGMFIGMPHLFFWGAYNAPACALMLCHQTHPESGKLEFAPQMSLLKSLLKCIMCLSGFWCLNLIPTWHKVKAKCHVYFMPIQPQRDDRLFLGLSSTVSTSAVELLFPIVQCPCEPLILSMEGALLPLAGCTWDVVLPCVMLDLRWGQQTSCILSRFPHVRLNQLETKHPTCRVNAVSFFLPLHICYHKYHRPRSPHLTPKSLEKMHSPWPEVALLA